MFFDKITSNINGNVKMVNCENPYKTVKHDGDFQLICCDIRKNFNYRDIFF